MERCEAPLAQQAGIPLDTLHRENAETSLDREEPASQGHSTSDDEKSTIDRRALLSLLCQHLSSSWGTRSTEFASFLFLSNLFPDTLQPASILGFCTTATAIAGAGFVGNLVDRVPRLAFIRWGIVIQKLTVGIVNACFLVLFLRYREEAKIARSTSQPAVWALFAIAVVCSCALNLSTIAISVSIERDWVTVISKGNSPLLTKLNAHLRRIDLLSHLLAPLFISLLTVAVSYPFAAAFLLGYNAVTMLIEVIWIQVVYTRLPILDIDERIRQENLRRLDAERPKRDWTAREVALASARKGKEMARDWKEFLLSPVFPSSLAVSLLYMTVLSFDGTLLTWLKSHRFSDEFVAGMRGICVVTGLMGTLAMPFLETRLGVVRAGTWSIVEELVTLVPVLLSFFVGAAREGERSSSWNAAMLFTGLALSRLGLDRKSVV